MLDEKAVAEIKGMLARGDRHMDIAVFHGINQARVSEIKWGKRAGAKYRSVPAAAPDSLPPPGPYAIVAKAGYDELSAKAAAHQELVRQLEQLLSALRQKVCPANTISS